MRTLGKNVGQQIDGIGRLVNSSGKWKNKKQNIIWPLIVSEMNKLKLLDLTLAITSWTTVVVVDNWLSILQIRLGLICFHILFENSFFFQIRRAKAIKF